MATVTLSAGNKASLLASTTVIARRTFLKFIRTPQLVVVGTVQGAMFLLILRYVFGGAINAGGVSYVNFLVPGFITTGIIWRGMMSAGGIAEDHDHDGNRLRHRFPSGWFGCQWDLCVRADRVVRVRLRVGLHHTWDVRRQ